MLPNTRLMSVGDSWEKISSFMSLLSTSLCQSSLVDCDEPAGQCALHRGPESGEGERSVWSVGNVK